MLTLAMREYIPFIHRPWMNDPAMNKNNGLPPNCTIVQASKLSNTSLKSEMSSLISCLLFGQLDISIIFGECSLEELIFLFLKLVNLFLSWLCGTP
jgi:hypothetical protein